MDTHFSDGGHDERLGDPEPVTEPERQSAPVLAEGAVQLVQRRSELGQVRGAERARGQEEG